MIVLYSSQSITVILLLVLIRIRTVRAPGPELCPDGETTGYSTWNDLKQAVEGANNDGGFFIICPDSTFTTNNEANGIEVTTSNPVVIQCGFDGKRENNCVIEGRTKRHFSMGYDCCGVIREMNVELIGITMKDATHTSVYLKPGAYGSYCFRDCLWEQNGGAAGAVLIQPYPAYGESNVRFSDCSFERNRATCGPIYERQQSNLVVDRCLFSENEATAMGHTISSFCASAIHAAEYETTLALSNSCFVGNKAAGPSVIHIDDAPNTLVRNVNNYYYLNEVGSAEPWSNCYNCRTCPEGVYVDEFYVVDSWCKMGSRQATEYCDLLPRDSPYQPENSQEYSSSNDGTDDDTSPDAAPSSATAWGMHVATLVFLLFKFHFEYQ